MTEEINSVIFGVWFLIGAALVFWMQAGFAMVEAGFTRAKNTGNIIMKNLMDFCIGTVMFILIGFGLFLGKDIAGLVGTPDFRIFTAYENFDWSNFVFNLVFCATTATIVSGAMAERTKFLSYCLYSAVISAIIYPIEAHWTWGSGFRLLGIQCVGMLATAAWTAITITITFLIIKHTIGLRVTEEEEVLGLDSTEHGLISAYAGFTIGDTVSSNYNGIAALPENAVPADEAVPVQVMEGASDMPASDVKLSKVSIICKQNKFDDLKNALNEIGVMGITVTQVLGCGVQKGQAKYYRGVEVDMMLLPKVKVEVVVSKVPVADVVKAARSVLYTGNIGDGKIFVYGVENVIKVRTGEQGFDALQGDE